jgi:glucose/arabinose dehydrogenase
MKKVFNNASFSLSRIASLSSIFLAGLRSAFNTGSRKNDPLQALGSSWFTLSAPLLVLLTALLILPGCEKFEDFLDHKNKAGALDLKLIADGFTSPIGVVAVPDESDKLYVIDQIGKIWILDAAGSKLPVPFLNLSNEIVPLDPAYDERGLLGLAFHPDYRNNGRIFVYYQLPPRAGGPAPQPGPAWDNLSRISEFRVSAADPNLIDTGSEKIILQWDDPQSNHNGGTLAFGPDRYLYISIGDGGAADDVAPGHVEDWYAVNAGGNGQDIEANLFGNILRIDIDNGSPYGIPADNPFVNKTGLDEIYAFGFRNPYRFSFDMGGAHNLYAGDAGQVLYEEIDLVWKGGNYGWNVKEGAHCFNAADHEEELPSCPTVDVYGNPLLDPIIELNNEENPKGGIASTIIGGNVYRGEDIPMFYGKYIFGTFSSEEDEASGELFLGSPGGANRWRYQEISLKSYPEDLGQYLKGFGQDNDGEIYLTVTGIAGPSGNTGKILKLVSLTKKNKWK